MAYILIVCTARYYDDEEKFFKKIEDELKKHFSYTYSMIDKGDHKKLILISYSITHNSKKALEVLSELKDTLKQIAKSFRNDITISLLGEALWISN